MSCKKCGADAPPVDHTWWRCLICRIFGHTEKCFRVPYSGPEYRCFGSDECCRCRAKLEEENGA